MAATIEEWVERGRVCLASQQYAATSFERYRAVARRFLAFLIRKRVDVTAARASHIDLFLASERRRYRRRHGRDPAGGWKTHYTPSIHLIFRLAQGCWPPREPAPTTTREQLRRDLRDGYRRWLLELRGLSELTFQKNWGTADLFLDWLGKRLNEPGLRQLTPADLDAFLAWRMKDLRRATRSGVCQGLRSFLRFLHGAGRVPRDLACRVTSPSRYWNETIPRAFTPEQIEQLLTRSRSDRSSVGRRDYAILLILARYGLRAGEIVRLRLEDIDWRRDRVRIVQSKNGRTSYLPLLPAVGGAILSYLQQGRPRSDDRALFLRSRPPHTPFIRGSSLTTIVHRHVRRCGLQPDGRHGTHAFRFARAVSLLRAAVPVTAISNILGHRSVTSTEVYLKLAEDDLRDVGLELPAEVAP